MMLAQTEMAKSAPRAPSVPSHASPQSTELVQINFRHRPIPTVAKLSYAKKTFKLSIQHEKIGVYEDCFVLFVCSLASQTLTQITHRPNLQLPAETYLVSIPVECPLNLTHIPHRE